MPDSNQTCIVTRNVVDNNFEIVQFVHCKVSIGDQPTSWLFLHGNEEDNYLDDLDQLEFMPLSRVILQLPSIREHLDTPVGGNFAIDQETGRIFDWTEQKTLTFDRRIAVPTAAKVRFNLLRWCKLFPTDTFTALVALVGLALAIAYHPAWLLVTVYFSLLSFVKFIGLAEHFKLGEARPSVIVSIKPLLVATEAVFDWKEKPRRFLKLSKIKRRALEPEQLVTGTVLASAVLFKKPKWYDIPAQFDFHSLPINYATTDSEEIKTVTENILPSYREDLEDALKYLPKRLKEGIQEIPPREIVFE